MTVRDRSSHPAVTHEIEGLQAWQQLLQGPPTAHTNLPRDLIQHLPAALQEHNIAAVDLERHRRPLVQAPALWPAVTALTGNITALTGNITALVTGIVEDHVALASSLSRSPQWYPASGRTSASAGPSALQQPVTPQAPSRRRGPRPRQPRPHALWPWQPPVEPRLGAHLLTDPRPRSGAGPPTVEHAPHAPDGDPRRRSLPPIHCHTPAPSSHTASNAELTPEYYNRW
jgi:hypothetical protein